MRKFIIVSPKTGKPVQNWTFAGKKHILYASSGFLFDVFPELTRIVGRDTVSSQSRSMAGQRMCRIIDYDLNRLPR